MKKTEKPVEYPCCDADFDQLHVHAHNWGVSDYPNDYGKLRNPYTGNGVVEDHWYEAYQLGRWGEERRRRNQDIITTTE